MGPTVDIKNEKTYKNLWGKINCWEFSLISERNNNFAKAKNNLCIDVIPETANCNSNGSTSKDEENSKMSKNVMNTVILRPDSPNKMQRKFNFKIQKVKMKLVNGCVHIKRLKKRGA